MPAAYSSVTHPSCAEETVLIYRYIVPRVYLYGGATHFAFRAAISASLTSTVIARDSASIVMMSPSFTNAIGPPTCASGAT